MLIASKNASIVGRTCVLAHNTLHDRAFWKRFAIVPFLVSVGLCLASWVLITDLKAKYNDKQFAATSMLNTMEAANKAVILISGDEQILFSTPAADKFLRREGTSDKLADRYPQLDIPVKSAIAAARKKQCGHSLVQFITPSATNKHEKLQVNVAAARVVDDINVVVSVIPLSEIDLHFDTANIPTTRNGD